MKKAYKRVAERVLKRGVKKDGKKVLNSQPVML